MKWSAAFPKTREELFAYRAIILGSVEAASFTPDQLRMLADFVSKRGGGLLMLGGRRSFAEGGWAGTPVAEVLPVEFDNAGRGNNNSNAAAYFTRLSVHPTRAGAVYPVTQLAETEKASATKWDGMPTVSAVNLVRSVKPGATVLLTGTTDDAPGAGGACLPALRARQVAGVADPGLLDVEDGRRGSGRRHDARHLLAPSGSLAGGRRAGSGGDDHEHRSRRARRTVAADARRSSIRRSSRSTTHRSIAQVTAPSGKTSEVPLEWTVSKDGEYRGQFVPDEPGTYAVKTTAVRDGKELGTNTMHARASAGDAEYFDAAMRSTLLTRVAEDTGGQFFTPDNAASLPEAINYSGRGVTVVEERDLWDMPIILMPCSG